MPVRIKEILQKIDHSKKINPGAEEKISLVLRNREIEELPIIFWKLRSQTVPGWTYDMKEQFYDKEKMLYAHLEEILDCAENIYDAIACLRPNFGTIFIPAILGLSFEVPKNTFPWLTSHLSKEQIKNISFPDLDKNPLMQKAIEYLGYFQQSIPPWIHVYLPDTQGPFDIAHALLGQEIFLSIYDDPGLIHHLLRFSTELYIEVTKRLKKVINEPLDSCYHGHGLARGIYMDNGGTRVSEDSATLLSPKHIDEFVLPYDQKALSAFGGGFVHYCGKHDYLLEAYLKMEEVRAINLGNPESYDFEKAMNLFMKYKKVYFGMWPKRDQETAKEYIQRMKNNSEGGKGGLLLHFDETMFPLLSNQKILEYWHEIR